MTTTPRRARPRKNSARAKQNLGRPARPKLTREQRRYATLCAVCDGVGSVTMADDQVVPCERCDGSGLTA